MAKKQKRKSSAHLIQVAEGDPRIAQLLAEIRAGCNIQYEESDTDYWGSDFKNGITTISHTQTNRPAACLAHELLHIKVQQQGIKQIRIGFWTLDNEHLSRFIGPLNNELQHHRFFSAFVALGFSAIEFYHENDRQTEQYLRRQLRAGYTSLLDAATDFFTLLGPGGSISNLARQEMERQFLDINGGAFRRELAGMRAAVHDWAQSGSFDNTMAIRQICRAMQHPCIAWFGFSDDDKPPFDGFFVDQPFEVDET